MQAAAPGTDVREIQTAGVCPSGCACALVVMSAGTRGASQGWWSGMVGHVRSSRQLVPLAAPQSATRPLGRAYPRVFAGGRSNRSTPRLIETCALSDEALPACGVPRQGRPPGGRVPFRVIADTPAESHMCLSASTRTPRGWVHPRHAFSPTPASRPPVARGACIQSAFFSAREACIPATLSARTPCIQASLFRSTRSVHPNQPFTLCAPPSGEATTFTPSPARAPVDRPSDERAPRRSQAHPHLLASHARPLSSFRHPQPLAHRALSCPPNGGSCPPACPPLWRVLVQPVPAGRSPVRTPGREPAS